MKRNHPSGGGAWCRRYIRPGFMCTAALVIFVLFFNDNSILNTYEHEIEIERLKAEIQQNRDTLLYYEALNRSLDTDPETMERIVREQYHMDRPGEDVFIFE